MLELQNDGRPSSLSVFNYVLVRNVSPSAILALASFLVRGSVMTSGHMCFIPIKQAGRRTWDHLQTCHGAAAGRQVSYV